MTANATSQTILQGRPRLVRRLCTGVSAALLLCAPPGAMAAQPQFVIWAWERPEDLRFAHGAEVAVQTGFINLVGDQVVARGRYFPLNVDPASVTTAVVHIQVDHRQPLHWSPTLRATLARKVLELARPSRYRRVQIDFEVRASERQVLLSLLKDIRAALPTGTALSMTALASWCESEGWLDLAPVDEIVPMLFRMGPGGRALKTRLAKGGDFGDPRCRSAYALSVDAPLARAPAGRRVYLFSPKSWTAADFAGVKGRVMQWRDISH